MVLEWWNDMVRWFASTEGSAVVTGAILPFLAIIVAGVIATLIARGSVKRLIAQQNDEQKASAIATLIGAARHAAVWNSLSAGEKDHADHQATEAEVRVRLLPVAGAGLAADWAAHQITAMKRNSTNYGFQAEQDLSDLENGLIAWHAKPARARKLFAQDLAAWKYETSAAADDGLASRQQEWTRKQESAKNETVVIPEQENASVSSR